MSFCCLLLFGHFQIDFTGSGLDAMRVPSAESGQRCQQLYGNDAGAAEVALGHGPRALQGDGHLG